MAKKNAIYSDILFAWLQSVRAKVKESTYMRYKQLIDKHIVISLGQYRLDKITNSLIEGFVDYKLKRGRIDGKGGLSPKTVTDIIAIIKSSMHYALYNNFTVGCNLSRLSVRKKEKELRILTIEEQNLLTTILLYKTDLSKLGILLSLYTGIRIGELCALRWENLSIENKTLRVCETMQRIQNPDTSEKPKTKIIFSEPKSKRSAREIPLPDFLIDIIKRFRSSPKAFILTGEENKYVEPRTMQNRFQRHLRECGIQRANYHALRHTFATRCVEVGFEIKCLSEILGHASVNITLNRYVHASFELKRSNMNKLSCSLKLSNL